MSGRVFKFRIFEFRVCNFTVGWLNSVFKFRCKYKAFGLRIPGWRVHEFKVDRLEVNGCRVCGGKIGET